MSPPTEPPWHHYLTLDLLLLVSSKTIFHPFIAFLVPLCLRALAISLHHPVFQYSVAYAVLITLLHLLAQINRRIAHGSARPIDLSQEVIVITGGSSGLGLLLAEVYGLRGVSVAVLDVHPPPGEARGISYYECDVGVVAQVREVKKRIEEELGTVGVLVNNAGTVAAKGLLELSDGEIERFVPLLQSYYHYHYGKRINHLLTLGMLE
jgi:hypothetical protein